MDNHQLFERADTKLHLYYCPQSSPPRPPPANSQPRPIRHTLSSTRPYSSRYNPSRPELMLSYRYERRIFGGVREDGYRGRTAHARARDDRYSGRLADRHATNDRWEREEYRGSIKRDSSEIEERIFSDGLPSEPNEGEMMGSKNGGLEHNDLSRLEGSALRAHLAQYTWSTSSHTRSGQVSFDEAVSSRCSPLNTSLLNSPFVPDMEEGDDGDASSCTMRNETPSPGSKSQFSYNTEELEDSIDWPTPESESKFPCNIEQLEQSMELPYPDFKFESQYNVENLEQLIEAPSSEPESQGGYNKVELEQWIPSPATQRRMNERLGIRTPSPNIHESPEQSPLSNSWVEVLCTPASSPKVQSSPEQSPTLPPSNARFQTAFNAAFQNWMTQHGMAIVEAAVKGAVKEMMGEMMGKEDVKTELRYEDVAVVEDSQGYSDDDEL